MEQSSERTDGVAAVDRACALLAVIAASDEVISLAELARRAGFYKSTALRALASLVRAGLVRRTSDGLYGAGAQALYLARAYQRSLRFDDVLIPILREMSQSSGETASFFVRDGEARVCLRRIEPRRTIRVVLHEGDRLPLARGAAGRVLSAFGEMESSSLDSVRSCGWAATMGERDPEAASISAIVFSEEQAVAGALVLSGPRERFDRRRIEVLSKLVRQAAARLSAALGGRYPVRWLAQLGV